MASSFSRKLSMSAMRERCQRVEPALYGVDAIDQGRECAWAAGVIATAREQIRVAQS